MIIIKVIALKLMVALALGFAIMALL